MTLPPINQNNSTQSESFNELGDNPKQKSKRLKTGKKKGRHISNAEANINLKSQLKPHKHPKTNKISTFSKASLVTKAEPTSGKTSAQIEELSNWQSKVINIYNKMQYRDKKGWGLEKRAITAMTHHGTHDSGTYTIKKFWTIIEKYSVTQSKTLHEQLSSGIRYLDLRIRSPSFSNIRSRFFSNKDSGYIIHHGLVDGTDCKPELDQVFDFARSHPDELLIMKIDLKKENLASLENFYKKIIEPHESLLVGKTDELGNTWQLSDIAPGVRERGNIILMIKDKNNHLSKNFNNCWDYKANTLTEWANTADSEELEEINKSILKRRVTAKDKICINQLQKTALTTIHNDIDAGNGLREQAKSVNNKIDDWLVEWAKKDSTLKPNIINTDFFDDFDDSENIFIALAFNLLTVKTSYIKKEFPHCYKRIMASRERIIKNDPSFSDLVAKLVANKNQQKINAIRNKTKKPKH